MYQLTVFQQLLTITEAIAKISFKTILILLVGVVIFSLIAVKAISTPDFVVAPLIYFYSLLVTIFALSRIGSAVLYRSSITSIYKTAEEHIYEPTVSFIIPCKNEEGAIATTIANCFAAEYPKDKLEVIVINDGSTDKTAEILALQKIIYPNLVVINFAQNHGKRVAMAEGFKVANGEILIQLDSDSYIDPKTFRNLITPFAIEEIGAVCAHADPVNADKNFITKMQAAYYYMSFRILKAAESTFMSIFCASGCSSAYRKSAVMPILESWLNEKFLGQLVTWGDDRALTSWLLKTGHKTIYTDKVQAYTIVPEKFKILIKQQIRWKKSWIINSIFTAKFIVRTNPFIALFYFLPLVLISLLTPFIAIKALLISPVLLGTLPLHYMLGVFLITSLFAIFCIFTDAKKSKWLYLYPWAFLNMIMFSYLILYSAARLNDRKWGTR
jgi:hyaluronan synthase